MRIKHIIASTLSSFCFAFTVGCNEGQEGEDSSLKEVMEDYLVCAESNEATCDKEEERLISTLSDEVSYRRLYAKIETDCDSGSVSCSGAWCMGVDGAGCICTDKMDNIVSMELCP